MSQMQQENKEKQVRISASVHRMLKILAARLDRKVSAIADEFLSAQLSHKYEEDITKINSQNDVQ